MRAHALLLGVLVASAMLLAHCAARQSPVFQEPSHMAAGVSHCRLGRFDLFRVNPPLVRMAAALLIVRESASIDRSQYATDPLVRSEYAVAHSFVQDNGTKTLALLCRGRWACILLTIATVLISSHWASALYGKPAAVLFVTTWCLSPWFLGHGATIMPDIPAACAGVLAVHSFWNWLRRPGWLEMFVAGCVLGMAQLCKFTLLVLYPLLPLMWVLYRLPEWKTMPAGAWLREGSMLVVIWVVSMYILNCGYLFEGTFTRLEEYRFQTTMWSGYRSLDDVPAGGGNRFGGTWLGKLPVPLPANMVQGIDTQQCDFERGLPSYLRGQWSDRGWWYFYLYALAVKTPLGTWCLVLLAVGVTVSGQGYNATWRDEMVVLVPGLTILVLVSSQTGFSVHSRYVIPALPFFFIWTSKVGRIFQRQLNTWKHRALRVGVVSATIWSVGSSLWVYPHSLSYFNEAVGGPHCGGKCLLDSNIDWGQDLLYLKRWISDHPNVKLDGLAYSGSYPQELAGFRKTPRAPRTPKENEADEISLGPRPGWYALSVNHLYADNQEFAYFLRFRFIGSAGYSIYIYQITPEMANRVRREMGLPALRGAGQRGSLTRAVKPDRQE